MFGFHLIDLEKLIINVTLLLLIVYHCYSFLIYVMAV
jgi:hypothetical protein